MLCKDNMVNLNYTSMKCNTKQKQNLFGFSKKKLWQKIKGTHYAKWIKCKAVDDSA